MQLKNESYNGPGNFGLLDPPGVSSGVGEKLITQNLASQQPYLSYTGAPTVRTGQVSGPVNSGIGVRFDMHPTENSATSQILRSFPPAPIVIKGKVAGGTNNANQACTFSDNTNAAAKLRDPCVAAGTCWQGNGAWQTTIAGEAYFTKNWGKLRPPGWPNVSRYETYLWELQITDENQTPSLRSRAGSGYTSPENPAPACYTYVGTGGAANNARRRTLSVAVIDCETNSITGNLTPPPSIMRIGRFCLTEPASGTGEIYAEFIENADRAMAASAISSNSFADAAAPHAGRAQIPAAFTVRQPKALIIRQGGTSLPGGRAPPRLRRVRLKGVL